ncbi:MAG: hypothetical protein QOI50_3288 [Pseudonocardiales bacterium]|jgi:hypothetical protein|nr:hypothetical protein [Pseudonocardiales bacterium]
MTLVVGALVLALLILERQLITTTAMLFILVLLIPSLVVDLLILFGPGIDQHRDPMSQYRSKPPRSSASRSTPPARATGWHRPSR